MIENDLPYDDLGHINTKYLQSFETSILIGIGFLLSIWLLQFQGHSFCQPIISPVNFPRNTVLVKTEVNFYFLGFGPNQYKMYTVG